MTIPYLPLNKLIFSSICLGLVWLGIQSVSTILLFQFYLGHHPHHKACSHLIISKFVCYFYLQCHLSHKCFDPSDVEGLLSLLENWVPAFLTNFKLVEKTATLLALVTAKCDVTLMCLGNKHLLLQHHPAIFIPTSDGKTLIGSSSSSDYIDSHSSVNLCPVFYLKAYFICNILSLLGIGQMHHM